ncbi:sigma-70 family RNA polymerase sigma factor [Sphingomonas sp. SRS2]|uniref:sigma-70 family RNA polymerase sigma factor n=1 Tax=Sphingomonas sp. SRS2 TaxID=133190 RepID=UPI00061845F2|nr:sigma-70 family RNA polymerase sigma factor [Sphingomonas sp. SRS2]KKC24713.1 ECF subfamily RNA polymerase sigma-24 factor [Sphingomonas sp. SRS2]
MDRWTTVDIHEQLPRLRGYARALTRDTGAADDLVQEALLRAYERAATYRPGNSLRSWLLSIVHNLFIDHKRREASEQKRNARLIEASEGMVEHGQQEQAVYLAEIATRFAALPEEHRAVLSLIGVQGLSYQEAATTLGVPVGTVMSRLHRARAALREPEAINDVGRLHIIGGTDAS